MLGMFLYHIRVDIILIYYKALQQSLKLFQTFSQQDPESEGTTIFRNISNYLPKDTANFPEDCISTEIQSFSAPLVKCDVSYAEWISGMLPALNLEGY
jgi:hypothetical protein